MKGQRRRPRQQRRQLLVDRGPRRAGRGLRVDTISLKGDDVNWSAVSRSYAGLPAGVACHHGLEQEEKLRSRRSYRSATGVHQQERDLEVRSNPGMSRWSCNRHRIIDQSFTAGNAGNDWKVQCVTTQLEPNVLKNPRDGNVEWRQDQTSTTQRGTPAARHRIMVTGVTGTL